MERGLNVVYWILLMKILSHPRLCLVLRLPSLLLLLSEKGFFWSFDSRDVIHGLMVVVVVEEVAVAVVVVEMVVKYGQPIDIHHINCTIWIWRWVRATKNMPQGINQKDIQGPQKWTTIDGKGKWLRTKDHWKSLSSPLALKIAKQKGSRAGDGWLVGWLAGVFRKQSNLNCRSRRTLKNQRHRPQKLRLQSFWFRFRAHAKKRNELHHLHSYKCTRTHKGNHKFTD